MANVKITDLTELAAVDIATNDVLPIVDINTDTTKKVTISSLSTGVAAANDFATFTLLNANINTVQSNVAATEARRVANTTAFTAEDTALQARLTTNVTSFTTEDTALQARITANAATAASNDFITFTRLNANINLVQDNVASVTVGTAADTETRLNANLNIVQDNVAAVETRRVANTTAFTAEDTALQARLTTNVTAFTNEDTALQARIAANTLTAASNDFVTFTRLNSNIDVVQDNVAAIIDGTTNFTGEVTMTDDLIVTGNLTVNGTTTTVASTNLNVTDRLLMLANGATGSPSADVGVLFNRGDEGNAAIFYDESATTFKLSDTKDPSSNTSLSPVSAANLDLGILTAATIKFDGADLNTAITDNVATLNTADTALQSRLTTNVTTFTNEDTALQSRLTTNVTAFTNEDTALQARIAANTLTAASNDFVTFTRLDANIDVVSSNATAVESRRVANIAGAVSTITTSDLTASRALVSSSGGKIEVSSITSTELAFLDGIDQNINSNLAALAAGIAATGGTFPTGDYGLLDSSNAAVDAFGFAVADLTIFDMGNTPAGELGTQDLGALS